MLLGAAADDRVAFHLVYDWTRRTLARHSDALFSWRYRPDGRPPVDDPCGGAGPPRCGLWSLSKGDEVVA
jgi:endo-1,4-beta-D-glucanase Y